MEFGLADAELPFGPAAGLPLGQAEVDWVAGLVDAAAGLYTDPVAVGLAFGPGLIDTQV
jgi:hypothetical protein